MVKNIEHLKLTPSSLKKATNIFKGESPNPSPNLGGKQLLHDPFKRPSRKSSEIQAYQALQQGGAKGSELELHIPF